MRRAEWLVFAWMWQRAWGDNVDILRRTRVHLGYLTRGSNVPSACLNVRLKITIPNSRKPTELSTVYHGSLRRHIILQTVLAFRILANTKICHIYRMNNHFATTGLARFRNKDNKVQVQTATNATWPWLNSPTYPSSWPCITST